MHIKSFLKKISEIPAVDISNPYRSNQNMQKRCSQNISRTDEATFNNKLISSKLAAPQSTFKFLNNHHPVIKARLLKSKEAHSNSQQQIIKTKFREKIQSRLMSLMNQRKDLILTKVKGRTNSTSSIHYNSNKERNSQKSLQKIPDYIQNIMKPCKVVSMRIMNRPRTSKVEPSKSQPRIYCKPLLNSSRRMRSSTAELSKTKISNIAKDRKIVQQKKQIGFDRLDGWNRSKNNEEQDEFWIK